MGAGIDLDYPFHGRWLVQNSPANRVPSHGTTIFATAHAIDFVPVDEADRSAPFTLTSLMMAEDPERFVGFGRSLLAPASGTIIAVRDREIDHRAHRGFPSLGYAATRSRRLRNGWPSLAGNHIVIDVAGVYVVLCHLRQGSAEVTVGQSVQLGEPVAQVGNTGNSTEPHLHVQAIDHPDPHRARAVPMRFSGGVPRNGEIVEA